MPIANYKEITDADFPTDVAPAKGLVFVEFYRDSCSSCRVFESTLQEIEELYRGQMTFLRLNTDGGRFHYDRLKCVGDPTCAVFFEGNHVGSYTGATMLHYFQPALQQILKDACLKYKIKEPIPVRL